MGPACKEEKPACLAPGFSADMLVTDLNFLPARPRRDPRQGTSGRVDYLYEPSNYLTRAYRDILTMRPTRAAAGKYHGQKMQQAEMPLPLRDRVKDLTALLKLVWRQGILADFRWQFWRQLGGSLTGTTPAGCRNTWKNAAGRKSLPDPGKSAGPSGPARAG